MKLRARHPFEHGGKSYQANEIFEVPEHDAHNLIQAGHAEEHKEESHFSTGGTPAKSQSQSQGAPFSTGGKT